jgi:O-phosphoseryl-tRNA(Cys) synthetase
MKTIKFNQMETSTQKIHLLQEISNKRQRQEMEELREILISESKGQFSKEDFEIGWSADFDMDIDIRNKWFEIDGVFFIDWVEENFITVNDRDKFLTVEKIRLRL